MSSLNSVPFFTAISAPNNYLVTCIEDYFHLGSLSGGKAVVLTGDNVGYKSSLEPQNYLLSALKIASYATGVIPLVMLAAKATLRKVFHFKVVKDGVALATIEQCWRDHVVPFTIKHGTSSLYVTHFKKHGISANYPAPLHKLITQIQTVWNDHEHDVTEKTGYFKLFESRYRQARESQKISVSFTGDTFRTGEYTTGARGFGGEWMREVRTFLRDIPNDHIFSEKEKKIVNKIRAFSDLLFKLPPMTLTLRGGTHGLTTALWGGLFLPLPEFQKLVTQKCPDWQNVDKLNGYLKNDLIGRLTASSDYYRSNYEVTVTQAIEPQELEFEILSKEKQKDPIAKDFPRLPFNVPTKLSFTECSKLQIHRETNTSSLDAYSDSEFIVEYCDGGIILTRIELSEVAKARIALQNEKKKLQLKWLQKLECPELACYL